MLVVGGSRVPGVTRVGGRRSALAGAVVSENGPGAEGGGRRVKVVLSGSCVVVADGEEASGSGLRVGGRMACRLECCMSVRMPPSWRALSAVCGRRCMFFFLRAGEEDQSRRRRWRWRESERWPTDQGNSRNTSFNPPPV